MSRTMTAPLKRGDKVTREPRTWYDGTPVRSWPTQPTMTVLEVINLAGIPSVWVRRQGAKGRDLYTIAELERVD